MTDIVFLKTEWYYQSYIDYWKLVELSGFSVIENKKLDARKKVVYIISPYNGEWEPLIDKLGRAKHKKQCRFILWDLERPHGRGGLEAYIDNGQRLLDEKYFDEIWVSDRQLANDSGFRYVTLGTDMRLGRLGNIKTFDFVHMSYVNSRRMPIMEKIPGNVALNSWPPKRNEILASSKFGLCTHQDDDLYMEPLRFALFAAYGLPIVTESLYNGFPYTDFIVQEDAINLPSRCKDLLNEPYRIWRKAGYDIRSLMCDTFRFRDMVLDAVSD